MNKKGLALFFTGFLVLFYIAIVLFVLFGIIKEDTIDNFKSAVAFEVAGFVFLILLILGNVIAKPIITGYFVPLITVSVLYTIILNIVNLALIDKISNKYFILINLILLFMYCLTSIPMYFVGRRITDRKDNS